MLDAQQSSGGSGSERVEALYIGKLCLEKDAAVPPYRMTPSQYGFSLAPTKKGGVAVNVPGHMVFSDARGVLRPPCQPSRRKVPFFMSAKRPADSCFCIWESFDPSSSKHISYLLRFSARFRKKLLTARKERSPELIARGSQLTEQVTRFLKALGGEELAIPVQTSLANIRSSIKNALRQALALPDYPSSMHIAIFNGLHPMSSRQNTAMATVGSLSKREAGDLPLDRVLARINARSPSYIAQLNAIKLILDFDVQHAAEGSVSHLGIANMVNELFDLANNAKKIDRENFELMVRTVFTVAGPALEVLPHDRYWGNHWQTKVKISDSALVSIACLDQLNSFFGLTRGYGGDQALIMATMPVPESLEIARFLHGPAKILAAVGCEGSLEPLDSGPRVYWSHLRDAALNKGIEGGFTEQWVLCFLRLTSTLQLVAGGHIETYVKKATKEKDFLSDNEACKAVVENDRIEELLALMVSPHFALQSSLVRKKIAHRVLGKAISLVLDRCHKDSLNVPEQINAVLQLVARPVYLMEMLAKAIEKMRQGVMSQFTVKAKQAGVVCITVIEGEKREASFTRFIQIKGLGGQVLATDMASVGAHILVEDGQSVQVGMTLFSHGVNALGAERADAEKVAGYWFGAINFHLKELILPEFLHALGIQEALGELSNLDGWAYFTEFYRLSGGTGFLTEFIRFAQLPECAERLHERDALLWPSLLEIKTYLEKRRKLADYFSLRREQVRQGPVTGDELRARLECMFYKINKKHHAKVLLLANNFRFPLIGSLRAPFEMSDKKTIDCNWRNVIRRGRFRVFPLATLSASASLTLALKVLRDGRMPLEGIPEPLWSYLENRYENLKIKNRVSLYMAYYLYLRAMADERAVTFIHHMVADDLSLCEQEKAHANYRVLQKLSRQAELKNDGFMQREFGVYQQALLSSCHGLPEITVNQEEIQIAWAAIKKTWLRFMEDIGRYRGEVVACDQRHIQPSFWERMPTNGVNGRLVFDGGGRFLGVFGAGFLDLDLDSAKALKAALTNFSTMWPVWSANCPAAARESVGKRLYRSLNPCANKVELMTTVSVLAELADYLKNCGIGGDTLGGYFRRQALNDRYKADREMILGSLGFQVNGQSRDAKTVAQPVTISLRTDLQLCFSCKNDNARHELITALGKCGIAYTELDMSTGTDGRAVVSLAGDPLEALLSHCCKGQVAMAASLDARFKAQVSVGAPVAAPPCALLRQQGSTPLKPATSPCP